MNEKEKNVISNLPCMTELDLSYNSVSDEFCSEIAKMKNLIILNLWGNQISNVGVAFLSQLVNLLQLSLRKNNIGSVGAAHLPKLKNLQILNLGKCVFKEGYNNIDDNGAKSISKMLSLR
jgi:Leucine-rich repeat (LRR) protein